MFVKHEFQQSGKNGKIHVYFNVGSDIDLNKQDGRDERGGISSEISNNKAVYLMSKFHVYNVRWTVRSHICPTSHEPAIEVLKYIYTNNKQRTCNTINRLWGMLYGIGPGGKLQKICCMICLVCGLSSDLVIKCRFLLGLIRQQPIPWCRPLLKMKHSSHQIISKWNGAQSLMAQIFPFEKKVNRSLSMKIFFSQNFVGKNVLILNGYYQIVVVIYNNLHHDLTSAQLLVYYKYVPQSIVYTFVQFD